MKIHLNYLCSLDWKVYEDGMLPSYESENNDYIFDLEIFPERGLFKKILNTRLSIIDKKTLNTIYFYNEDKLFDLYKILEKEGNSIKERMYEEVLI